MARDCQGVLTPLYDRLVSELQAFGGDVELTPKKAYVSVRRSKQFALLQPSTASRLDVGLVLKGAPPTSRLEASAASMRWSRIAFAWPPSIRSTTNSLAG